MKEKIWDFIRKHKNKFHVLLGIVILLLTLIVSNNLFFVGITGAILSFYSEVVQDDLNKGTATVLGGLKTFSPIAVYIIVNIIIR